MTRRLHLELDERGGLVVVAPPCLGLEQVHELLEHNRERVDRFLVEARARRLPPLRWSPGARHLYRGEYRSLAVRESGGRRATVEDRGDVLDIAAPRVDAESVRKLLSRWYRTRARQVFAERLDALRGKAPWATGRTLTLDQRRMRRTWGTCRAGGSIRLNTHLIKAPPETLDYVLCHELCHLAVMNHGAEFYALQSRLYPDWRRQRAELRAHGHRYLQE